MPLTSRERARAALGGLAVGDALGMPTQLMSRPAVIERFGVLHGFHAAAADHPIVAGRPAGSITDDTEQALLLARLLVDGGGRVDPLELATALLRWEAEMRRRGSLDLLGPSTRLAVEAVRNGTAVAEAGRSGATNGAAMRITPVGICTAATDMTALVDRVVETSMVSHHTGLAISGAAAVAAAVSAGVAGATLDTAIAVATRAAGLGAARGHWVAGGDVARRISWAVGLADPAEPERSLGDIHQVVGTSLATQESVPAAFGILATFPADPWQACLAAAGLGGDSDTVAAMVGAIGGATCGSTPQMAAAQATVEAVNGIELSPVADALLRLRASAAT